MPKRLKLSKSSVRHTEDSESRKKNHNSRNEICDENDKLYSFGLIHNEGIKQATNHDIHTGLQRVITNDVGDSYQ
jgi:hypothetical protein